jgi:hypothetical protein
MDQMIVCAMAMVALRWRTRVSTWRMVKDREHNLVTCEGATLHRRMAQSLARSQNREVSHD